ncbi:hypothetical protein NDN08_002976 [Rhodosorus marinus]|uniref:Signal recognition particle 54 kDa protein n=1 Tax=Rhodosorus marinus TaxID=101924 RepID=A0AAV8UV78_9RHOD|nr:hypothetical protein NDN08_002976 [Rhodosorus marinus]
MVLGDLGKRINRAIRLMSDATVIDEAVVKEMLNEIAKALLEADVNIKYVAQLKNRVLNRVKFEELAAGVNKRKMIQGAVVDELCALLDSGRDPVPLKKGKPNVIMFVGLQGNGKTTSCVKYAHYHQRKGWKTALVCADTFRAGAFDQLKQNATKARIPFYGSYTETDPVKLAIEGVNRFKLDKFELIIVDTSGRHKQEKALFEEMEQMSEAVNPNDVIFVMDSSIGQAAEDQAKAFRSSVSVGSVIVTKLDGHAKGGGALSAVSGTGSPITFIGIGEHMTDFEPFNTQSFVGRLLGLGDISGLMNMINEADIDKDVYERIAEGHFTLRDMRDQFENIGKLGPLSSVMTMLPHMQNLLPAGKGKEGEERVKQFMVIMDSMTDAELDNPKIQFTTEREMRVARGAGVFPTDVRMLLKQHKEFAGVVEKMGSMKGLKNGNMNMLGKELPKMINPQMLKKMGGAGNLQSMLKQAQQMENSGAFKK